MRYKQNKFGCDWSIMKGTLLEYQGTFSCVTILLVQEMPWLDALVIFPLMRCKHCQFGCDQ